MGRIFRSCIQSILKLVNSIIGMIGIAMVMYAIWMIRVWNRHMDGYDSQAPWFIYTFLGLGGTLCLFTCFGHAAAETGYGCCLYFDWEKDFPEDPTGNLNEFKNFVRSNFEICKWIGLSIVSVQGLSILLAMLLKALGPHQYYDSDDEYAPTRAPLLRNAVHPPPYVVGDPFCGSRSDAYSIRINEKIGR